MKKFAKSLLCLVMALMLIFSFAACSDDKDNAKDEEETKAETVKEDDALPSVKDAEKAVTDLLSDDETLLEITGMSAMLDSMVGSDLTDEQAAMVEDFIADILDFVEIDVTNSFTESDTNSPAYVTVEVSYPDFENMDVDSYTSDPDYMMSILEDLGYDEESLSAVTDENEMIDILFEVTLAMMEDIAQDADVISVEETVEVVYESDEWVVVTE